MKVITYESGVEIYKTTINPIESNLKINEDILDFLSSADYSPQDNYTYLTDFDFEKEMKITNKIDEVIKFGVEECSKLRKKNGLFFNKINVNCWINLVRSGKPKQNEYKSKNSIIPLHNHIDLQKKIDSFYPTYTFVYYVQMPNNLIENEGCLIIGGKSGQRYYFLPKEGDLVIMSGELPHCPNTSPNSTKNRIVIAGNVGFEHAKKMGSII